MYTSNNAYVHIGESNCGKTTLYNTIRKMCPDLLDVFAVCEESSKHFNMSSFVCMTKLIRVWICDELDPRSLAHSIQEALKEGRYHGKVSRKGKCQVIHVYCEYDTVSQSK